MSLRILFYANAMPSFFAPALPGPSYVTGGWITGAVETRAEESELPLGCAFPLPKDAPPLAGEYRGLSYFGIPMEAAFSLTPDPDAKKGFSRVLSAFLPDVIQLWGTESASALPLMEALKEAGLAHRAVIHIQGPCGEIARAYEAGLPKRVVNRWTLRDLLRQDNIACQREQYVRRGENEGKLLRSVSHVMGRTDFDRAASLKINPNLVYHHCNENLRPGFYEAQWDPRHARPHSIFFSQGNYPLKGLHFLLQALPDLIQRYPDLTLTLAGGDPTRSNEGLKGRLLIGSYGAYLRQLLKKYRLKDRVRFLGTLHEEKMIEAYRSAALYVSGSALENSPNSLGEAMLLGMPLVATAVGGVPSVVSDQEARLVPYGDVPALVSAISAAFDDREETDRLRLAAEKRAAATHDRAANRARLLAVYREIAKA